MRDYQECCQFQHSTTMSLIIKINGDQNIRQSKLNHALFSNMSHLQAPAKWPNLIFGIEKNQLF